jgi:hypothetical protein
MNVKPKNYQWREFYDHVIDLTKHSFSWRAIGNRFRANRETLPKWMNVVRAISTEGFGRIGYHTRVRRLLDADQSFEPYFEGQSASLSAILRGPGATGSRVFWEHLPPGALYHDPKAYLKAHEASGVSVPLAVAGRGSAA